MKYKVGDRVRIKNIDWYKENRNDINEVKCGVSVFVPAMTTHCGCIRTISEVFEIQKVYHILEDSDLYTWTDEMIEGLAIQVDNIPNTIQVQTSSACSHNGFYGYSDSDGNEISEWYLPEGYIFKDENGNVINATKIVLGKKKKEYPKTYEECLSVLGIYNGLLDVEIYNAKPSECKLFESFIRLKRCRDAYWKIAGDEMGLGKPWEPDYTDPDQDRYVIANFMGNIEKSKWDYGYSITFVFPTAEMRDAFKKNFDPILKFVRSCCNDKANN